MRFLMILLVPLVILAVYNARADADGNNTEVPDPGSVAGENTASENRYSLRETENGLVRLDRHTGMVTLCTGTGSNLMCKTVADDRVAYEDEIRRLYEENQALRDRLAELESGQGETALLDHDGERYVFSMELPNSKDVQNGMDAVGEFAEDVATGFAGVVASLKERFNNEAR